MTVLDPRLRQVRLVVFVVLGCGGSNRGSVGRRVRYHAWVSGLGLSKSRRQLFSWGGWKSE